MKASFGIAFHCVHNLYHTKFKKKYIAWKVFCLQYVCIISLFTGINKEYIASFIVEYYHTLRTFSGSNTEKCEKGTS